MAAQMKVDVGKIQIDRDIPIPPPSKHEAGRKASGWKPLLDKMAHGDSVHFNDAYQAAAFSQYVRTSRQFTPRSRVMWVNMCNDGTRVWVINR